MAEPTLRFKRLGYSPLAGNVEYWADVSERGRVWLAVVDVPDHVDAQGDAAVRAYLLAEYERQKGEMDDEAT